jgi:dipeptidyl aminopeptidase/acylaminoacyl peptidase
VGSPIDQLPVGRPVLVVHGDADTRVPVGHSTNYVEQARAAGDQVESWVLPGVDHLALIDPTLPHWADVAGWMASRPSTVTRGPTAP